MSRALFFDDQQIAVLREILDFVPLTPRYMPFVVDLLQRLPEPSSVTPSAGGTPAVHTPVAAGGFRLIPLTQKGADNVDRVNEMLARLRLPHGDSL